MAFKKSVGGGYSIAKQPCPSIAIVWAMQVGEGKQRRIDSCTKALK